MRRAAIGVLAGTLACTGAIGTIGLGPASAVEGFSFERLDGDDRYDTAVSIARQTSPPGAATALVARATTSPTRWPATTSPAWRRRRSC